MNFNFNQIATELSQQQSSSALPVEHIPTDPQLFYQDFGLLIHPRTLELVPKLTSYQEMIWKDQNKYKLIIKSQKVGLSTSLLMEDIQDALTWAKGMEILLIAQNVEAAKNHLYTIRKLMSKSAKYKKYLIMKPEGHLFRDEIAKVNTLFIRNPEDPQRPTRIIGLGSSEASVWSWKNVKKIHMSDVAAIDQKDDAGLFNAAFSRLANTEGKIVIETPPRGQQGTVFRIYRQSKLKQDADQADPLSQFKVYEIPAAWAVAEGVISQEFLDNEKARMGPLYAMYYECEFLNAANVWYMPNLFTANDDVIGL